MTQEMVGGIMILRRFMSLRSWTSVQFVSIRRRCFGSSSTEKQSHNPKLSKRSKRDVVILTLGGIVAGMYLRFSNTVEEDLQVAMNSMMMKSNEERRKLSHPEEDCDEELPPPLMNYINKVMPLHPGGRRRRLLLPSISMTKQSGKFLAAQKWYPFEASLWMKDSFEDPAFIWMANTNILGMPQQILQTFLSGKGSIITKAWGYIPTVQVKEEEPYILFWLGMIPLCPQALMYPPLKQQQQKLRLEWTVHDLNTARARLITYSSDEEVVYHVEFQFDPSSSLLQSITVTADCINEPWKASYHDYRPLGNDTVVRPSRIEIGKGEGSGSFRYHMRINNWAVH